MSDHLAEARKVLARERGWRDDSDSMTGEVVRALDRAGLLATDLHKRALAACEDYAENYEATLPVRIQYSSALRAIGHLSLALKQPKPRWAATRTDSCSNGWKIVATPADPVCSPVTAWFTEQQARAVADALNKLDQEGK